jgi:hypothetical protein
MKVLSKTILGAAIGAGILALSGVSASAAIACSGNVCWHTHETYVYPKSARIVVHEDSWRASPKIVFKEHEGRGYWRGGVWTTW